MGPVEVLWDGDGAPPSGEDRHTPVKTVPSGRTTYAGGKNAFKNSFLWCCSHMTLNYVKKIKGVAEKNGLKTLRVNSP